MNTAKANLETAIATLKTKGAQDEPIGYRGYDAYPAAFQAPDFPLVALNSRLTANNHAFFFVSPVKEDGKVVDVKLNTTQLERAFAAIVASSKKEHSRSYLQLQIDADLFENPVRFIEKYQALRSEPVQTEREALLAKEGDLIRSFVANEGFRRVATSLLKPRIIPFFPDHRVDRFFERQFRFEGVQTADALPFATWELLLPDRHSLVARQEYKRGTYMADRPWQLGHTQHLCVMAAEGHSGALQVLRAVEHTYELPRVNLTNG